MIKSIKEVNLSIASKISEAIQESGISKKRIAEMCGVKPPAITGWEKSGSIGKDTLLLLAEAVNKPLMYFISELSEEPSQAKNQNLVQIEQDPQIRDVIKIPQYKNVSGGMGHGVLLRDQPGEIQNWSVTPDWINKNVKNHTGVGNLCIVTGFGDSMRGMFNPGDPLLVDKGVVSVEFDAVYFFRVGNEGFIKTLQRIPKIGLRAISANKEYETWTITQDMDFKVLARVIKVWESTDF